MHKERSDRAIKAGPLRFQHSNNQTIPRHILNKQAHYLINYLKSKQQISIRTDKRLDRHLVWQIIRRPRILLERSRPACTRGMTDGIHMYDRENTNGRLIMLIAKWILRSNFSTRLLRSGDICKWNVRWLANIRLWKWRPLRPFVSGYTKTLLMKWRLPTEGW